ncbi:MAG: endolytic transglycosylase MltG [Pseudomonadota bacterium]
MKSLFKALLRITLLLTLLAVIALATLVWDARRQLLAPLSLAEVERVSIERGERFAGVIDEMQANGVFETVRQGHYLLLWARATEATRRVKAGEFDLAPGTTPLEALEMFIEGRSVLSELRLPEGWKFSQAFALIASHEDLEHTLPDDIASDELMKRIGYPGQHPEGRFFPDTYRFTKGMSDVELLRHAARLMNETLAAEWAQRAPQLPYASANEALTMASIVEKETGAAVERARIAGVFMRRLKLGMLLQTDPTVIYGIGDAFDGNLRRVDLERDTPYNSYTRKGLPPTPICLPGRAAIHAALHPEDDGSVFFVARGDGTHQFSKTYAEHNAAVTQYQLRGR